MTMVPTLMPSVRCLARRVVYWLMFRQERLLSRLDSSHLRMMFPSSTFYIPLEELCVRQEGFCVPAPSQKSLFQVRDGNHEIADRLAPTKSTTPSENKEYFVRANVFSRSFLCLRLKEGPKKVRPLRSCPSFVRRASHLRGKAPYFRRSSLGPRKHPRHGCKLKNGTRFSTTDILASALPLEPGAPRTELAILLKALVSPSCEEGRRALHLYSLLGAMNPQRSCCVHPCKTAPRTTFTACGGSSPAPLVPVRTHASTNHKQLHSNRFGSLPVSDTPLQRDGRLGVTLSQPALGSSRPLLSAHNPHIVSQTGLHKPQSYKLAKSLQSISKYPSGDLGVPRPTTNPPSAPPANQEFLKLEGSKSVPLNSLYRSLLDREYFHPVARSVVGEMLTEDGMFLVRPSTHSQHPLTLSVCNKGKVFNFVIRSRSDAKFALGTEKAGETAFVSVEEMIKFHKREPIKVEDGSLVYLKISPAK